MNLDRLPHLVAELDRYTGMYPYARKLLICTRPAEGRELLRALTMSGRAWVGWEPLSLRQLAHAVVGERVAREAVRTADAFDVMAAVDGAIDKVEASGETGPFPGPIPGSYRDPIRRTVESLRLAGVDGADLRAVAGRDPKLRMLAAILVAYEARLGGSQRLDGPELVARAADALGGDALGEPGQLLTLPSSLASAELFLLPGLGLRGVDGRLVRALLARGARVLATDPVEGLPEPAGRLWAAAPAGAGPLARLHGSPDGPTTVELFAAATPADELREVMRRVLAAGVPWDQVEIVATDAATYGPAMDGLARRFAVPVTHSAGLPLSRTRVGRAVDAYFRWIGDGFPVDPIRRLLEAGDLGAANGPADPDPPSSAALARRLRRLRIGWGHDRYLEAVDRALAALDRAGPVRDGDRDGEAAREARERERAELGALRGLLAPILDATPRPASRRATWTDRTSPAELAAGLLALLDRVPAGDAVENTARTVLIQRLERARVTLTRQTGWRSAMGILRSRLQTRIAATTDGGRLSPWTSTGGHLHLSDVSMGGMAGRPYTFVVGLAAGVVGAGGTDPLLTDPDRLRLNRVLGTGSGGGPRLDTTADRITESRHALAAMLARLRGRVTLSFSAWDMTEGRTIGPAHEMLLALRLREGNPTLSYEDLRRLLGRLACAVPAPEAGPGAMAEASDVWLAALATADGRLRDGRVVVRAAYPGLDRGLAAESVRSAPRLTPYHGLLPPAPELDPCTDHVVVSPSRLETLGACPLRYFYQYVVGVRPIRDPAYDPEQWLDPLERGSLLHSVYERALAERPPEMDYAAGAFLDHTLAILDQEVRRTLHRLPAPNEAVLFAERGDLEADARSFVLMVREERPAVLRTELVFGPDADSEGEVTLAVAGGGDRSCRLRVRGRVDRVDSLPGGGLRVVDYKTGRAVGYGAAFPFNGGRRLQHMVYALAVEQLVPGRPVEASEYHFPTVRGENEVARYTRSQLQPGHVLLGQLLDLARTGRYLATRSPNDCRFCDFGPVCRVTVDSYGGVSSPRAEWARDYGDQIPEYAALIQLRKTYGDGE
jgi:hypothetical protein